MSMWLLATTLCALPAGSIETGPGAVTVASAAGPTQLQFEVEPESVIIWVDGKKKGVAKKLKHVPVKPGTHSVKLVWNKDETEFDIKVDKGKTVVVKYAFEDSGSVAPPPEETPAPAEDSKKKDEPKAKPKKDKAPEPPPADEEPGDDLDSDIPR